MEDFAMEKNVKMEKNIKSTGLPQSFISDNYNPQRTQEEVLNQLFNYFGWAIQSSSGLLQVALDNQIQIQMLQGISKCRVGDFDGLHLEEMETILKKALQSLEEAKKWHSIGLQIAEE